MVATFLAALSILPIPGWSVSAPALAREYAPVVIQQMRASGSNRTQDLPVAFDFDGDWDMRNNWKDEPRDTPHATPVVYYAAMATKERAYLTYYLFYPRDWDRVCLPFMCHENDFEQLTVAVDNDGTERGRPLLMDVKYHLGDVAYPLPGSGAVPLERTAGALTLSSDGRPVVHVEWGGHGITSCDQDGDGELDLDCARPGQALILEPEAAATFAVDGPAPHRRYDLRDLHDTLWQHREAGSGLWTSAAFAYAGARLGRLGEKLGVSFGGSGGGARAPWGIRTKLGLHKGDQFFDPALALAARWRLPGGEDALPYVEDPYLADLKRECAGQTCGQASVVASSR